MAIGIYVIRNKDSGKVYVGSSVNISKRWRHHLSDLRLEKHHALRLQRSWNKYGESAFFFEIVENLIDPSILIKREQYWIDAYKAINPINGYNVCPAAGTVRGTKRTDEQIKLMRDNGIRRGISKKCREARRLSWNADIARSAQAKSVESRKANGNYKFSDKHRNNLSKSLRSRPMETFEKRRAFNKDGVRVIREALSMGWLVHHLALDMGCCKNTILKIKNGTYGVRNVANA